MDNRDIHTLHRIRVILIAVLLSLLAANSGIKIVFVAGDSMLPNYENGNLVIATKWQEASTGDVVVIRSPSNKNAIKRIIGMAGDTIEIIDGQLYRNSEIVIEGYIVKDRTTFSPVFIPEGMVFVLGDNRPNSIDSREYGCLPIDEIIGTVMGR